MEHMIERPQTNRLRLCTAVLTTILALTGASQASAQPRPSLPPLPEAVGGEAVVRHLAEFEARVGQAPAVLAAVAELEESLGRLNQARAEAGWRLFADGGAGRFREQVAEDQQREYNRVDLRAGLKHPLLGSRQREESRLLSMETEAENKIQDKALALRESLLTLRLHYINYWAAQEKGRLADLFLNNEEDLTHLLTERASAGHLLTSDLRETVSAFFLVRRQLSEFTTLQRRASGVLALMTGTAPGPFEAAFPVLPAPCTDLVRLETAVLSGDPMILQLQRMQAERRKKAEISSRDGVDGHVALYSKASQEFPGSEPGYGLGIEVGIDLPLHWRRADTARRRAATAALDQSRLRLEIAGQERLMAAREALDAYRAAEKNIAFAVQRLSAAQERLRENLLRYAYLPGDVLEKVQQSRWDDYRAAIDAVEAWAARMQAQARLLSWMSAKEPAEPVAAETTIMVPPPPLGDHSKEDGPWFSAYVWDSRRLEERFAQPEKLLSDLMQRRIRRLLIAFTADQMRTMASPRRRQAWRDIIVTLRQRGVRVELLLGEPSWLLPRHRPDLLQTIRRMADLPFEGIHLDLEPDQLPPTEATDPLALMEETIVAVRKQTALWLGLSIHPRYADAQRQSDRFAARLIAAGLNEILLMVYVTDPERTAAIAAPILRQHSGMKVGIAQSVEPELSAAESHGSIGRDQFMIRMENLYHALPGLRRGGIAIQSWEDYDRMSP
jgi:outer membrane protein TolC